MIARAVQQAITNGVKQQLQMQSKRTCYPYYHRLIITRPRNRIAFAEKVFWGVFISTVIASGPAWIMYHHREYGQKAEE